MERTKEADLVTAVLIYAMRCLAEGDHAALRDLHFGFRCIDRVVKFVIDHERRSGNRGIAEARTVISPCCIVAKSNVRQ